MPSAPSSQCRAVGPSACGRCSLTCVTLGGKRQGGREEGEEDNCPQPLGMSSPLFLLSSSKQEDVGLWDATTLV